MKRLLMLLAIAVGLSGCASMGGSTSSDDGMMKAKKGCREFTAVYQKDGKERTHVICDGKSGQHWAN